MPDLFSTRFSKTIEANVSIHDPAQGSWLSWLPPVNSCLNVLNTLNLEQLTIWAMCPPRNNTAIPLQLDQSTGAYVNANVSLNTYDHQTLYKHKRMVILRPNPTAPSLTTIEPAGVMDSRIRPTILK